MTDKVKDGSRYNGSFQQEGRSVGSYFFRKSELSVDTEPVKRVGTVPWWMPVSPAGVQRAQPFVGGMQRGGSSLLGLRGNAHYRVKGKTHCPVI